MHIAIIGGTGMYGIRGKKLQQQVISTRYGPSTVFHGQDEDEGLVFLARHGVDHRIPPHRINYRANIQALKDMGVERVMGTFAIGSINEEMPPMSLILLDQFIDFTSGRDFTFFDGGDGGLAHTEMTRPYCPALRSKALQVACASGIVLHPRGTYVCTNGPRLETAAEIKMFKMLGADVVGMTGVPEAPLAREAGLHYAAIAFSINWAAGVRGEKIAFHEQGIESIESQILEISLQTLRTESLAECECRQTR